MQHTDGRSTAAPGAAAPAGGAARSRKRFELLEECRETILERLTQLIAQALMKMSDELTAEALRSTRSDRQQALLDAVMVVRENRMEIETRFRRGFADIFERRLFPVTDGADGSPGAGELSLVSDDVISDKINVDRLVGKARSRLDPDEVLGIRARFGALLERDWFEDGKHPVSPEAVFEALKTALAELSPRSEVQAALLDAFEPHVSQNLNGIYVVVNERLRAHHVLPKIRPQVQSVGGAARRPGADAGAAGAVGPVAPGAPMGPLDAPWVAGSFGVVHPHGAPAAGVPPGMHAAHGPHAAAAGAAGHGAVGAAAGAFGADGGGALLEFGSMSPAEALSAFERAVADASAGRPAGRANVARMLTNPTMFGVADIPVTPVDAPLVDSLTALQRGPAPAAAASVLPEIVQRVREKGSALDQITVEIVSMVFDYIYADRRLPDSIKQQLLRLQVVAVKAALLDRSFFARRQHPMRRLLDRISDVGADPDVDLAPGAPLVQGLGEVIDRIVAEFDSDLTIFDDALERIEALAREAAQRRVEQIEAAAREAARQEALALAQDDARAELSQRLDKDTPAFVREFLHRWWTPVLAALRTSYEGDEALRAWETGLRTADYLVWSVAPKQSEEIPRLANVLPGLIRGLRQGLEHVAIPDSERAAFFDELLREHTLEIAAAKKRAASAAPRAAVAVRLQDDGSVRFVAPAREPAAAPVPSATEALLAPLRRGQRLELTGDGEPRTLKLAWISPARKLFILSRYPDESVTFPAGELAFMLQRGLARVVDGDSTLDRAIGQVTGVSPGGADGPEAADASDSTDARAAVAADAPVAAAAPAADARRAGARAAAPSDTPAPVAAEPVA
jgi:hypothetical protein